ncbi:MAG: hypothetical protein FWD22_04675 [Treponema sp.]|nr:hypothetical protein [Treponema sp.]
MNKNIHIDNMRKHLGITLEAASKYNAEHKEEISRICDIFHLKGADKEKVLALLYMLSLNKDDDILQKYCDQTNMTIEGYTPENILDKYKLPLITALIYERTFYAIAVNYREAIGAGLAVGGITEKKDNVVSFTAAKRSFSNTSRIYLAAAAGILVVFFVAVLFRAGNPNLGPQTSNTWVLSLRGPAGVSGDTDGTRIDLISPLIGMAMSFSETETKPDIRSFSRAVRPVSNNPAPYIERGVALALGGYLDSAVKDFDKAIELDPLNSAAYYNRAIANIGRELEDAVVLADFETAITLNPGDKDSYYAMGVFYYRKIERKEDQLTDAVSLSINAFSQIRGYKDTDLILDYLNNIINED